MKSRKYFFTGIFLLFVVLFSGGKSIKADAAGRYTIYVNRKTNIVNVVNQGGKVVRSMYCSTGKGYSTIRGTYYTQNKMKWHALYHGVFGQYCTRIHGAYLFHSVWYYRTRKDQVSVKEYNLLGSQASAGCVRLAVVDAKWIYDNCRLGTRVVIGESRRLKKPARNKIKLPVSSQRGWDPTDPDPANPYYPKIKLKKGVSKKIKYGSEFDPLENITVSSKVTKKKDLLKCVAVKGKVKVKKPGKYKLTYTVTDPATLLSKSIKVTYTVGKEPAQESTGTKENTAAGE